MERITRTDMFTEMVKLLAKRSKCKRLQVGALILDGNHIISTGCNGPSKELDDNLVECGCPINHPCGDKESIHAEVNAIADAAKRGTSLRGTTILVTTSPCYSCAKLIERCGIKKVYYLEEYKNTEPIEYLIKAGLVCKNPS